VGVVAGSAAEAVVPGADDAPGAGPASEQVAGDGVPDGGVDISWGDKAVVVPTANDGTILSGGLREGLLGGTPSGLDGQVTPVSAPGETLAQTGPMITGQLALVSLLLGLGLLALRSRRRRIVV
ncbi:hypothetical protein, partial [Promicromonospora kroppenstedtii]|uniref:hypothetical protein n=1 Tax=Promicromonospora kroppenstedtii TaxID=440482 RepID=UPI00055D5431